jgi:hypothetical protein
LVVGTYYALRTEELIINAMEIVRGEQCTMYSVGSPLHALTHGVSVIPLLHTLLRTYSLNGQVQVQAERAWHPETFRTLRPAYTMP